MTDQEVGEFLPVFPGDDLHEFSFDRFWRLRFGQSQSPGQSSDVGVDDDPVPDVVAVL